MKTTTTPQALPVTTPARAGRPARVSGGRKVNVYLGIDSLTAAAALGSGNLSEGIRRALAIASAATPATLPEHCAGH